MASVDEFCYARENDHRTYRRIHKPVPGLYDGLPIVTCAWCGKTLEEKPT